MLATPFHARDPLKASQRGPDQANGRAATHRIPFAWLKVDTQVDTHRIRYEWFEVDSLRKPRKQVCALPSLRQSLCAGVCVSV